MITTRSKLDEYDLTGYVEKAPTARTAERDAAVVAECWPTCPVCVKRGTVEYRPFTHPTSTSYRAFAVCHVCGFAEEF